VHNKLLLDLVDNMACTLGYVEDVEQFARLEGLKTAIEDVRPLVEATTNFVLKTSSRGELGIAHPFIGGTLLTQLFYSKNRTLSPFLVG
jgi:hypothetical protein